jgi:hypothetical protein
MLAGTHAVRTRASNSDQRIHMTDWNLSHEFIKTLKSIASTTVGGVVS